MSGGTTRTVSMLAALAAATVLGAAVGAGTFAVLSDDTPQVREVTVSSSEPVAAGAATFADVYADAYKSVVEITASGSGTNQFGGQGQQQAQGSGFVYSSDGIVVTNQHVVERLVVVLGALLGRHDPSGAARRHRSLDGPRSPQGRRAGFPPRPPGARQLEQPRGRGRGGGDRQPLRPRGHVDHRSRERAPPADDRAERLHDHRLDPDRRRHQPRELGRPPARYAWPRRRRQRSDRERLRRKRRDRVRDPFEHGSLDRRPARGRRRRRACVPRRPDHRRGERRRR